MPNSKKKSLLISFLIISIILLSVFTLEMLFGLIWAFIGLMVMLFSIFLFVFFKK